MNLVFAGFLLEFPISRQFCGLMNRCDFQRWVPVAFKMLSSYFCWLVNFRIRFQWQIGNPVAVLVRFTTRDPRAQKSVKKSSMSSWVVTRVCILGSGGELQIYWRYVNFLRSLLAEVMFEKMCFPRVIPGYLTVAKMWLERKRSHWHQGLSVH